VKKYLALAEERTEAARQQSQQTADDVDDLDVLQTPERYSKRFSCSRSLEFFVSFTTVLFKTLYGIFLYFHLQLASVMALDSQSGGHGFNFQSIQFNVTTLDKVVHIPVPSSILFSGVLRTVAIIRTIVIF